MALASYMMMMMMMMMMMIWPICIGVQDTDLNLSLDSHLSRNHI